MATSGDLMAMSWEEYEAMALRQAESRARLCEPSAQYPVALICFDEAGHGG
jgi:hypothetical protein